MELILPSIASRLDVSRVTFLPAKAFADFPRIWRTGNGTFDEKVFDELVSLFCFKAVGAPSFRADDFMQMANPLGPALSALINPSSLGSVAQNIIRCDSI